MPYSSRLELVIDSRSGERSLKRVKRGLDDVDRAGDRAQDSARGMGRELGNLRTVALAAGGALAAMGVTSFSRDVFNTVSSVEKMRASLATVTGSIEGANSAWEQMREFAKTTPFELEQSVQGFIRMKSLGLDPTERAMRSFANTAAAMNTDLMQMVEAVADATVGEFERLREYGIRASQDGDRVSLTFQGVTTEIGNNAREIQQYLENIGNTNFADAAIDQMDTLGGKANNLGDSITDLYLSIGEAGATDLFNAVLDGAADAVDYLNDNVETLAAGVELLSDAAILAAAIYTGRFVAAMAAGTASIARKTAANIADAKAESVASQQLARRSAAELASAKAMLSSIRIEEQATRGTAAHKFALDALSAARVRAAEAAGAHTVATNAATTAMGRASIAARGLSGAMALVGGPAGVAVLAAGSIYYFREELGLVPRQAGLAADEIERLRGELDDLSDAAIESRISTLTQDLKQVALQAAAARDELSSLNQEASGAGVLGFDAGHIGQTVRATTALGNALDRQKRIEQEIIEARQELGSRNFKTLDEWLFENPGGGSGGGGGGDASKDRIRELERQADALEALRREFDPMREAQADYNERLGMLNEALARGVVGQEEYGRGIRWAADQLQQAAVDAAPYLSRLEAINEEYVKGRSLGDLFAQQQAAKSITGPAGKIARSGIGGRIEEQVMQGAPVVEGLDPEYGGAFGELQRIQQEREALQAWYDEKIAMYQQYRELETENAAQYDAVLRDLRQSRAEAEIAIQQQERSAILSGSASMFGSLAQMSAQYAGDSAGITKALIGFQQVANIAQMLGYLGVGTARQFADLPWYAAVGTAASVGAQIGSLLSMVKGVETPATPSFSASSYAGAFDNGGSIPSGKWGIAGEYGPEIIEGPARVTSRKQTAEMLGQQSHGNHTTVNVIEDASRAGQVNERQDADGKNVIDVVVADIAGDGKIHKAISSKYALSTKGR
ncbi:hypothetical protein ACSEE7_07575 [Halomonas cupida]|uniref:hypothetical protein n=1 Tax=Halomonas cupida TaxID=44933 RepID=UPI003EF4A842